MKALHPFRLSPVQNLTTWYYQGTSLPSFLSACQFLPQEFSSLFSEEAESNHRKVPAVRLEALFLLEDHIVAGAELGWAALLPMQYRLNLTFILKIGNLVASCAEFGLEYRYLLLALLQFFL